MTLVFKKELLLFRNKVLIKKMLIIREIFKYLSSDENSLV